MDSPIEAIAHNRLVKLPQRLTTTIALLSILLGTSVLTGWWMNWPALTRSGNSEVIPMMPNTALCFILIGFTELLLKQFDSFLSRYSAILFTGFVFLLALTTCLEYLRWTPWNIDELLLNGRITFNFSTDYRMAFSTCISFMMMAIALTRLIFYYPISLYFIYTIAFGIAFYSGTLLISYSFNLTEFYFEKLTYTIMSLNTSVMFLLLSISLFLAHIDFPIYKMIAQNSYAGQLIRRTLPFNFIFFAILGWVIFKGLKLSWYNATIALALYTMVVLFSATLILFAHATLLQRAEDKRIAAEEERNDYQKQLEIIFNESPYGIAVSDPNTTQIHLANRKYCEIKGISPDKIHQKKWIELTHPFDIQADLDHMKKLSAGLIDHFELIKRYIKPDGSITWVKITIVQMEKEKLSSSKHFCMVEDISEKIHNLEEIKQLNEKLESSDQSRTTELEAANQELDRFSYFLSHDLKTHLETIDKASGKLAKKYASTLDRHAINLIHSIETNTHQMDRILDDISALFHFGRKEIHMELVNMKTIIQSCWEELTFKNHLRKIQLKLNPLPLVRGDPRLLKQVIKNLMENAIKFTEKKDLAIVEAGCQEKDTEYEFYIKDNGIGFNKKQDTLLFTAFHRFRNKEEFANTGMELEIVERIITRHGGKVYADISASQGAV